MSSNNPHFKHLFTIEEANKTLPLVKRIVEDILNIGRIIRAFDAEYGAQSRRMPVVQQYWHKLEQVVLELDHLGCFYQDWSFELGLVDFPAEINGRIVFLCWRSDEPAIQYYHELDAGYAGRQPLPELPNAT